MTTSSETARDDAALLAETARRFLGDRVSLEDLRSRRDDPDTLGRVRETWAEVGALGWAGMLVPTDHGGTGSWRSLGTVLRELGAALAVTPMVATGVVATLLLRASPTPTTAGLLERISRGDVCVAVAHDETAHADGPTDTTITPTASGNVVSGHHENVVFGPVADYLLVCGRCADPGDRVVVVLLDPHAPGVAARHGMLLDGQPVTRFAYDDVAVPVEAMITSDPAVLVDALAGGALAIAASAVGGARRALDLTVRYLATREQFGVPIGAFQALQHRAARLYCEVLLADALVERAFEMRDEDHVDASRLAHASKARATEVYQHVAAEGVQMHGGIGMTDECEIGFHFVAARVAAQMYGDSSYHRRRYADLVGY